MSLCEKCLKDAVERTATEERWGTPLCDSCATSADEAAYERSLSDYYGGSGAQTIREQYDAAAKQKRETSCGHIYGTEFPCPQCPSD